MKRWAAHPVNVPRWVLACWPDPGLEGVTPKKHNAVKDGVSLESLLLFIACKSCVLTWKPTSCKRLPKASKGVSMVQAGKWTKQDLKNQGSWTNVFLLQKTRERLEGVHAPLLQKWSGTRLVLKQSLLSWKVHGDNKVWTQGRPGRHFSRPPCVNTDDEVRYPQT